MFADIIIDITHEKLDKVFQYRIPPELEGASSWNGSYSSIWQRE